MAPGEDWRLWSCKGGAFKALRGRAMQCCWISLQRDCNDSTLTDSLHNSIEFSVASCKASFPPDVLFFLQRLLQKLSFLPRIAWKYGRWRRSDRAPKMSGGVGTWRYMAPEVVRYEQYDEKIDIYAFGLILYFIFSGRQCLRPRNSSKQQKIAMPLQSGILHDKSLILGNANPG